MSLLVALIASYALGSIPAAYIAGRSRGIDLRKYGSGNLGATNVFRVLGPKIGVLVFAFDMAKGAVPATIFAKWVDPSLFGFMPGDPHVVAGIACGVAAIVGHVRPMWLKFGKGGKGVATSGGVFLALAPMETLLAILAFAVTVLASGYVSLGSLVTAVLLPTLLLIREGPRSPMFVVCTGIAIFVFWAHRANIARLRAGIEHRFGKRDVQRKPTVILAIAAVIGLSIFLAMRFQD
jgi:acyl phosphate:glycerol-3-phosphate acyltransferase